MRFKRFSAYALCLIVSLLNTPSWAQTKSLPSFVYFPLDWCPRPEVLTELEAMYNLTPLEGSCCLVSGSFKANSHTPSAEVSAMLVRFDRVRPSLQKSCTGRVKTAAEEADEVRAAAEARSAAIQQHQSRVWAEAIAILKELPTLEFCAAYGSAVRGEGFEGVFFGPDGASAAKAEARRRKLRFDDATVRSQKFRIGSPACDLFASLGLPMKRNRTVSAGRESIQHVYASVTVYTVNGVVTSWQD
jgi:hypothetical protein